jgi:hypothetical protein
MTLTYNTIQYNINSWIFIPIIICTYTYIATRNDLYDVTTELEEATRHSEEMVNQCEEMENQVKEANKKGKNNNKNKNNNFSMR